MVVTQNLFNGRRNFWNFKRLFPDVGEQMYSNFDPSVQRALDRERDSGTNGTGGSMSASLRGSNSSLNSMPGSVISTCDGCSKYNACN